METIISTLRLRRTARLIRSLPPDSASAIAGVLRSRARNFRSVAIDEIYLSAPKDKLDAIALELAKDWGTSASLARSALENGEVLLREEVDAATTRHFVQKYESLGGMIRIQRAEATAADLA